MLIIGDVHGCFKTLKALIKKCPKDEEICLVGDLIDRGPRSKDVVQFVIDNKYHCVLGNHEDMLLDNSFEGFQTWQKNGADQTLKSYKIKSLNSKTSNTENILFEEHKAWMRLLPLYLLFEKVIDDKGNKLLVTHSSAAKVWKWREEESEHNYYFKDNIIWQRNYNPKKIDGIFNVFGHTPVKEPVIKEHFAFIDTGCVFNGYEEQGVKFIGKLTALRFPQMEVYQQDYID